MIDYMVMEAVYLRVKKADEKARKDAEAAEKRKKWKNDRSNLERLT